MTFRLNTRKLDDVMIIDMNGKLTCGEPRELLRATVRRLLDEGHRRFVLNLSEVTYMDTTGLTELLSTKKNLTEKDGDVHLLGVTKNVKDLLVMTKLIVVFDCFDNESQAIAAFQNVKGRNVAVRG